MTVSHRRLLSWQTAAQAEAGGKTALPPTTASCGPPPPSRGLPAARPRRHRRCGGGLALRPHFRFFPGPSRPGPRPVREEDRRYLVARSPGKSGATSKPSAEGGAFPAAGQLAGSSRPGVAHRTSPTNIGLALVSVLAALDLGVAEKDAALALAEKLSHVETLPNGGAISTTVRYAHPPLPAPQYVSTVDTATWPPALRRLPGRSTEYGRPTWRSAPTPFAAPWISRPCTTPPAACFSSATTPPRIRSPRAGTT